MDSQSRQDKTSPVISLSTPLRYVKGIGPERYKLLLELGLRTFEDALHFFPRRYEDRTAIRKIRDLTLGDKECVFGVVMSRAVVRMRGRLIFRAVISDGTHTLFASWFGQPYLSSVFLPKSRVILYGKSEQFGRHIQMFHPEYEILKEEVTPPTVHSGRLVPIYPLTEDLSQKSLRQLLFAVTQKTAALLRDPLPAPARKKWALRERVWAVKEIHFPTDLKSQKEAYARLVFDEFFATQLLIQRRKNFLQKKDSRVAHSKGEEVIKAWTTSLGFELTEGQKKAMGEVMADMKRDRAMARLVQGEVGSGKTVVAAAGLLFLWPMDARARLWHRRKCWRSSTPSIWRACSNLSEFLWFFWGRGCRPKNARRFSKGSARALSI